MEAGKALVVEKILVRADRIVAHVIVSPAHAYTTKALAKRVLLRRPSMAHHACVNEAGPIFASVINHTPLPHLFEHIVVDILAQNVAQNETKNETKNVAHNEASNGAQNAAQNDVVFTGTSEWTNREAGQAKVEVSYTDDLEALAAFKEAEEFLNNMTAS